MTKYLDQPGRGSEPPGEAPTVDAVGDAALAEFVRRGAAAADAVREAIAAAMGDGLEPAWFDSTSHGLDELALVLGGSGDSWTGAALRLIAKSDPMHRAALLRGIPVHVLAWEAWVNAPDARTGIQAARNVVAILNRVSAGAYGTGRLL